MCSDSWQMMAAGWLLRCWRATSWEKRHECLVYWLDNLTLLIGMVLSCSCFSSVLQYSATLSNIIGMVAGLVMLVLSVRWMRISSSDTGVM